MDDTLNIGERNRAWFKPGPGDDLAGTYQVRFRNPAGVWTSWQTLTSGAHPKGGPGWYCWVATADVPDAETGDVILAAGRYTSQLRYASGRLVDLDDVGPLYVQ